MKLNDVIQYIRKNYFVIAVGICALVVLLFLSENFSGANTKTNQSDTDIESELESFLSELQGVGECDVLLFTEEEKTSSYSSSYTQKITGIAVVCEGGGNSAVKTMILEVLTRLFGISGSRISINEKTDNFFQ